MVITADSPTVAENQGDHSAPDSVAAQTQRALTNQGDTLRASWKFSLDAVRSNIAYMSNEAKELLVWAFLWCTDPEHPIHFDEFCQRIGYDRNTVYKAYSGKLRHPTQKTDRGAPAPMDLSDKWLRELRDFKRVEVQRAKLGRNQFVMTPTAKRIFLACDLARESQTPVFIQGASQIGKNAGCEEYCITHNHGKSRIIELQAVSGLHGLVKTVAEAIGISPRGNAADLTERIRRGITSDMVLIFNEVHLLAHTYRRGSFFACMEWIRRLYDYRKFGLVLTFTELGFEAAEKERKRELEQIFRRGVHRVNLGDRPTTGDVKAIVEWWGLPMPSRNESLALTFRRAQVTEQPYEILSQLAIEQGMGAIVERLRYGAKFAADRETQLTWEHVVEAHLTIQKNQEKPAHGWERGAK